MIPESEESNEHKIELHPVALHASYVDLALNVYEPF
jgi:hypothetical protein